MYIFANIKNIVTSLSILLIVDCSAKKPARDDINAELKEAARILDESSESVTAEDSAAVQFKNKLNGFFPASLTDFTPPKISGSSNSNLGFPASRAEALYVSADDKRSISISVTDLGETADLQHLPTLAWYTAEINRDSADYIERTSNYNGIKTFEQFYPDDGIGEIQLMLSGRYIVDIDGFGVSYAELKGALQLLNLEQVNRLR